MWSVVHLPVIYKHTQRLSTDTVCNFTLSTGWAMKKTSIPWSRWVNPQGRCHPMRRMVPTIASDCWRNNLRDISGIVVFLLFKDRLVGLGMDRKVSLKNYPDWRSDQRIITCLGQHQPSPQSRRMVDPGMCPHQGQIPSKKKQITILKTQ
jgi:hypothetical protein